MILEKLTHEMTQLELQVAVLSDSVRITTWEKVAIVKGWTPPVGWYEKELADIDGKIRLLIASGEIVLTRGWKLRRGDGDTLVWRESKPGGICHADGKNGRTRCGRPIRGNIVTVALKECKVCCG